MEQMRISVLDQSPISEGCTGADALRNTLDLARLADQLGFTRYWVAEHHGTPTLASASPEVMIAAIGSITRRIRVGSGGVMLPYYSPLKVAETFSILSALFPDRVDLGVGRAPGADRFTASALLRDRRQPAPDPDDFPQQLGELLGYVENRTPPGHPFARLAALPGRPYARTFGCWAPPLKVPFGLPRTDCLTSLRTSSILKARHMPPFTAIASASPEHWPSPAPWWPAGRSARKPMRRRNGLLLARG